MYNKAIRSFLNNNLGSSCVGNIKIGGETNAIVVRKDEEDETYEVGDLFIMDNGVYFYMPRGVLFGLSREEAFSHACNIVGVKYTNKQ